MRNTSALIFRSTYRRSVPDPAIAFSSHKGKLLFAESLASGHLDSFFELSEQFRTQSEPSLCGASSLTMVLNALGIDPNKVWKGPWRIFSEEMLKCSKIKNSFGDSSRGITMARLACLARCNGAVSKHIHASNQLDCDGSLAALRRDVLEATRLNSTEFKCHLIASYSRSVLGQTGDGHFSPIGGYHPESDSVLLLDVARFKYPPHWIRLQDLHRAMLEIDPDTGKSRGWISLSSQHNIRPLFFLLLNQQNDWSGLAQFLQEEMTSVVSCSLCDSDDEKMMSKKQVIENNRQEFVGAFSAQISSKFILGISSYVKEYGVNYITPDYEDSVMQLLSELRSTAMFTLVQKALNSSHFSSSEKLMKSSLNNTTELTAEYLCILLLSIPEHYWKNIVEKCYCEDEEFSELIQSSSYSQYPLLSHEIKALRYQMEQLLSRHHQSSDLCSIGNW